jgi:hypothetical protein
MSAFEIVTRLVKADHPGSQLHPALSRLEVSSSKPENSVIKLTCRSYPSTCVSYENPKLSTRSKLTTSSATRIQLRKGRGDERIAKLNDSPDMPEGEATYTLKSGYVLVAILSRIIADEQWLGRYVSS